MLQQNRDEMHSNEGISYKKIRETLLRVSRKAFVLIVRIVQITTAVPLVATISMEFDWPMVS